MRHTRSLYMKNFCVANVHTLSWVIVYHKLCGKVVVSAAVRPDS